MNQPIFSPYRICPLGAHVDHQGGVALGRTLSLGTSLSCLPSADGRIRINSRQLGEAEFQIGGEIDLTHWARYAQAAARVLEGRIQRGMLAEVDGPLVGAGLSSSASVGLAYVKALAGLNDLDLSAEELVELDHQLETGQLGLQNGLLDPLTIVHGRQDALLFMDTNTGSVTPVPDPPGAGASWIIANSGTSRELTRSSFNQRVAECRQAAALLQPGASALSAVPREVFEDRKRGLPPELRLRAEHYFGEVERVRQGAQAWAEADLASFGQLMNQSCGSSIRNYGSSSPVLVELHELASSTPGIHGSRFSGGGYGGCVVALAERERADGAALSIAERFSSRHPELRPSAFVAGMGDGLR